MPFSEDSKREIKQRARYVSELSGRNDRIMHCSHNDHTKDEDYDSLERATYCTDLEHLAFHMLHRGQAERLGLSEYYNEYAIRMLTQNVLDFGVDDLDYELNLAAQLWLERL